MKDLKIELKGRGAIVGGTRTEVLQRLRELLTGTYSFKCGRGHTQHTHTHALKIVNRIAVLLPVSLPFCVASVGILPLPRTPHCVFVACYPLFSLCR